MRIRPAAGHIQDRLAVAHRLVEIAGDDQRVVPLAADDEGAGFVVRLSGNERYDEVLPEIDCPALVAFCEDDIRIRRRT